MDLFDITYFDKGTNALTHTYVYAVSFEKAIEVLNEYNDLAYDNMRSISVMEDFEDNILIQDD